MPDEPPAEPRHPRPKIMLVDVSAEDVATVRAAGYRVTEGSLGTPLTMPAKNGYMPALTNGKLPGLSEQEIVVLQQRAPAPVELQPEDVPLVTDDTKVWASTIEGSVDTRSRLAALAAPNTKRILEHGGVAIVFCDAPYSSTLVTGTRRGHGDLHVDGSFGRTVWDFVPQLDSFSTEFDHGEEITPGRLEVFDVLAPHLKSATFNCTLHPGWRDDQWFPLATNKYGKVVAGVLLIETKDLPEDGPKFGFVLLLPQVEDVGACVTALLDNSLPDIVPRLFPESDRTTWLHADEYELPEVQRIHAEIASLREEAERQEGELQKAVELQRNEDGWMHTLITGTGEELVDAVSAALSDLGLLEVIKVDDEKEAKETGRRREDIQVWGESPVILVEVKGITNLPRENNALQVVKYLVPRMRSWDRRDIRGLSVINQQRGLPALDRENVNTFQQDVLDNAADQGFGLVTTIDLFRLVRNKRRWGWPDATVAPLLYSNGRIQPVPTHYELIGAVDGFFEKAGVVTITATAAFAIGEVLAYRLPIDYVQERVGSIRLDDADVQIVEPGQRVGLKTSLNRGQASNGVLVYRVNPA